MRAIIKNHYKSPFPEMNVYICYRPVVNDTIYYDTYAINNGSTSAHLFVGTDSLVSYVYGTKIDKQF